MPREKCYVAVDLGAESGRVILGRLGGGKVKIEEIHRFPNVTVSVLGTLRWDLLRIFGEIKEGLAKIGRSRVQVSSVSTDSWGVSYALLGAGEPHVGVPFHYRDARTDGGPERAFRTMPKRRLYAETGTQMISINTLYQLIDDVKSRPKLLKVSDGFLLIADYFNYLLSGVRRQDESNASTTQVFDACRRRWSEAVIRKFRIPRHLFSKVVKSGTPIGRLLPEVAAETGLRGVKVVAGCSHDTAAAVAAVPASGDDWAYISSGTWSLMGIELRGPCVTDAALKAGFTNELGFNRTVRFLKNINGLFVLQECRKQWQREGKSYSYDAIEKAAAKAPPHRCILDLRDPLFSKPGNMPAQIRTFCRRTRQPAPKTMGETARSVLEGLAFCYRRTLDEVYEASGIRPTTLHIVGGGCKNLLLNQLSSDAGGIDVRTGPVEATAVGNVLVQAAALGDLPISKIRTVVRNSFRTSLYRPRNAAAWKDALERYRKIAP
jgi:rhamnulokinase